MLKVIIPRILDLSITKYFDSLKKHSKKKHLASGQKVLGFSKEQHRIGFKGDREEDLHYLRPRGKKESAEPERALRQMNDFTELSTKVSITDFQVRRN